MWHRMPYIKLQTIFKRYKRLTRCWIVHTGALSMAEWLHLYRERFVLWSEGRQFVHWLNSFQNEMAPTKALLDVTPVTAVAGAFWRNC